MHYLLLKLDRHAVDDRSSPHDVHHIFLLLDWSSTDEVHYLLLKLDRHIADDRSSPHDVHHIFLLLDWSSTDEVHYLFLKLDRHAVDDRSRTDEVCHLTCLAGLLHEAGEGGACLAGQPCLQQFLKEAVNVFVCHVPQVS